MICERCSGRVIWKGPLSALTHTQCESCGGTNCQLPDSPTQGGRQGEEEGEFCFRPVDDEICMAKLELQSAIDDESPYGDRRSCTCFQSAPCGGCLSTVPECPGCGWRAEEPN